MNLSLTQIPRYSALLAGIVSIWAAAPAALAEDATAVPTELFGDHLEMSSSDTETFAITTGNVVLTGTNLRITCDRLEMTASRIGDKTAAVGNLEKIKFILAIGNVHIVQGDREATCQRAEVFPREDKVVLTGDPVFKDHSNGWVGAGEKITLFRSKREVFVEKIRLTGPAVGDLSATAKPRPSATPAAAAGTTPPPVAEPLPAVTFPRPAAR
jgi:lipopolysaccharide export system protein LptA